MSMFGPPVRDTSNKTSDCLMYRMQPKNNPGVGRLGLEGKYNDCANAY